MDWLKIYFLACFAIMAVGTPFLLAKAIRRRENARIFDIVICDVFFIVICTQTIWPEFTAYAPRLIRWLMIAAAILVLLNMFGLSRRLFKVRSEQSRRK